MLKNKEPCCRLSSDFLCLEDFPTPSLGRPLFNPKKQQNLSFFLLNEYNNMIFFSDVNMHPGGKKFKKIS